MLTYFKVTAHHTVVFGDGDSVEMENKSNDQTRFLLIAGEPLNEPVVQHGKDIFEFEFAVACELRVKFCSLDMCSSIC